MKDRVGFGRDGRVGSFGDESRADLAGVLPRDLILHGRRDEDRNGKLDDLLVRDVLCFLEAGDTASDLAVLVESGEVKSVWVVNTTLRIADGHHLEPSL